MLQRLFIIFILLVSGLTALYLTVLRSHIEWDPPTIELVQLPAGIGSKPAPFAVRVVDSRAGVASLTVELQQQEKQTALLALQPEAEEAQDVRQSLTLPGQEGGFAAGSVKLRIKAVDRSWLSNTSILERELPVDLSAPRMEVLTQQFIAQQGGSEFVVVRVKEENLGSVDVRVGSARFRAAPLHDLDPRFAAGSDLWGILFAIPLGHDAHQSPPTLFASDAVGNQSTFPLRFTVRPYRQRDVEPVVSEPFLREKVADLLPRYTQRAKLPAEAPGDDVPTLLRQFKLINEDLRALLDGELQPIFESTPLSRRWRGVFVKPMPSATSSDFGEKRRYRFKTQEVSRSQHNGLDLASVKIDSVRAAHGGTVVFAGELGIYGEAVVIDHGMGLTSLYAHLSSIAVQRGTEVAQGEEIGRSGQTGLAGGDHLHFEFRVAGVPVTPIEWWDPKWIQDNIDGKLDWVSAAVGVS